MNIYAIRDRLLDYYMQPFAGPDDKNVLAAVARTINTQENMSDIAQAPHHFEVWRLGKVTETGHIEQDRELVADCASLVRPGIRTTHQRSNPEAHTDASGQPATPGGAAGGTRPNGRPVPPEAQPEAGATAEVRRGHRGGYPPPTDD